MHSALAGQADVCLVPKFLYTIDGIVAKLKQVKASGRNHAIIVVSEGVLNEKGEHLSNNVNMVGEAVYGGISDYLQNEITAKYDEFKSARPLWVISNALAHLQHSTAY